MLFTPIPVPSDFKDIEEWILDQLYEQPKVKHMTHTLFQQLERVMETQPSARETINSLRKAVGKEPLSEEEYVKERKVEYSAVQRAVETLIEQGWARGTRDSGVDGVYFKDLKLTAKGEAEAIRRKRNREKSKTAVPNFEERLLAARKRAGLDGDKSDDN